MKKNNFYLGLVCTSILLGGCQSMPTQNQSNFEDKTYNAQQDQYAKSLACTTLVPAKYKGYFEVSSAATVPEFVSVGKSLTKEINLTGQSCLVLTDAYKTCSTSNSLQDCVVGYLAFSSELDQQKELLHKAQRDYVLQQKLEQEEKKAKEQEIRKKNEEYVVFFNNLLTKEDEIKGNFNWTLSALNERKLKLVNLKPKTKDYVAVQNEVNVLEQQLSSLRETVLAIDEYKAMVAERKQRQIAENQNQLAREQHYHQQMYQQQLAEQQRVMHEELRRQQMMNNMQNYLNSFKTYNCTSTGMGGTVYTNCR